MFNLNLFAGEQEHTIREPHQRRFPSPAETRAKTRRMTTAAAWSSMHRQPPYPIQRSSWWSASPATPNIHRPSSPTASRTKNLPAIKASLYSHPSSFQIQSFTE